MKKLLVLCIIALMSFASSANAEAVKTLSLGLNALSANISIMNYSFANLPLTSVTTPKGYDKVPLSVVEAPKPSVIGVALNFISGGSTGTTGPTQSQLTAAYANTPVAGKVTSNGGVQQWLVPTTGTYQIRVLGAQGGINGNSNEGGKGANLIGTFNLTAGQKLDIIVGQKGVKSPTANPSNGGSGGGGGSFVWVDGQTVPLVVAGGGGGSCLINNGAPYYIGMDASTSTAGTSSRGGSNTAGTNGGDASNGGGRGWNSVKTSPNGAIGMNTYGGDGGFGGGGGGGFGGASNVQHTAGGGGGYSGGAISNQNYNAGGGGGSYNSGTNQSSSVDAVGDGKVTITQIQ